MADDLLKKFENFDSGSVDRGLFLKEIAETIRTTDVSQSLKDIVNRYDTMFGPDPTTYSRNTQVPYLEAIRKVVNRLTAPPVQGSGKRKSKKTRKSRRHTRRRRY